MRGRLTQNCASFQEKSAFGPVEIFAQAERLQKLKLQLMIGDAFSDVIITPVD